LDKLTQSETAHDERRDRCDRCPNVDGVGLSHDTGQVTTILRPILMPSATC
jgi:hypothetical protein